MVRTLVLAVLFFISGTLCAQRITVEEYVATYKDAAIAQMKRLGVPAAIILAQGILETENGNSDLVKKSNNHFGIKCKSTWTGMSVTHTDDAPNECFRKYSTSEESYKDHSDYLYNTPRYAFLFQLDPTDYKGWAYGLKKAGYATNPRYPQILIGNIEKYNLQQYNSSDRSQNELGYTKDMPATADESTTVSEPVKAKEMPKEGNIFSKVFSGRKNKPNQYFNRLKAVMVFRGTSLLAVATENDVPLARLMEYNDLTEDGLAKEDEWIYLEKKHKEGNRDTYTALQNETLHNISQNNAVQLPMLAQYNQLNENSSVKKGTVIRLRPGVQVMNNPEPAAGRFHEVQAKEGLYSIAKKYNVTVDELKEWNQLTGEDLRLGQQLIIAK
jgi:LysM repeat protein